MQPRRDGKLPRLKDSASVVYRDCHSGNLSLITKIIISYTDTKIFKVESRRVLGIPYTAIWFDEGLGQSSVPPVGTFDVPNPLHSGGPTCVDPCRNHPRHPVCSRLGPFRVISIPSRQQSSERGHQHQPSVRYGYSLHYRHRILHGSYLSSLFPQRTICACAWTWTWTWTWHNSGQSSPLAAPLSPATESPPVSDDDRLRTAQTTRFHLQRRWPGDEEPHNNQQPRTRATKTPIVLEQPANNQDASTQYSSVRLPPKPFAVLSLARIDDVLQTHLSLL